METIYVGIGTVLGTAILLIIRDWRDGKSIFKKNGDSKYLVSYYNHDLTERLDNLLKIEEKEHSLNQETRDILFKMNWLLEDIKEHGINCRK